MKLPTPPDTEVHKVAISSGASLSRSAGHFYWHYRRFGVSVPDIRPEDGWLISNRNFGGARSTPVLSPRAHGRRFKVGVRTIFDYNFRGVREALEKLLPNQRGLVYLYEGSLADLCMTLYLAPRLKNVTFCFNFFWPRHWSGLMLRRVWLWELLLRVLHKSASNILFFADTPKFAEVLSNKTGVLVSPFPVFSPFRFTTILPLRQRPNDLFISLKRPEEWAFAKRVLLEIPQENQLKIVVTGPEGIVTSDCLLSFSGNIEVDFLGNEISEQRYVELLASTKLVFLPYLKEHYLLGSSGKLVEACQAGCVVLVPEDSGLSSQIGETEPETWATFSISKPDLAARSILELINASPNPIQRLHNVEHAMAELEAKHQQRILDISTSASRRERHWIWLEGIFIGALLSLATYWDPVEVKARLQKVFDRTQASLRWSEAGP